MNIYYFVLPQSKAINIHVHVNAQKTLNEISIAVNVKLCTLKVGTK